jgi:probable F420-dependent oxidoreductase
MSTPETRFGMEVPEWMSPRDKVTWSQRAEERGLDDIFMSEIGDPDALVTGGLVLNATRRVRFATCILQIGPRTVPMLAIGASTLAEAFPGRFALGIGVSSQAIVEGWHGVAWDRPLQRAGQAVQMLRELFAGGRTDHAGAAISSKGFRLNRPPAHPPPIQLAALNEQMLRLAARVADGVWLNFLPRQRAAAVADLIRDEAGRAGRPTPEILLSLPCFMSADPAVAEGKLREMLAFYMASPAYRSAFSWHGFAEEMAAAEAAFNSRRRDELRAAITRELVDSIALVGTPAEVRTRLDTYRQSGITTVSVGVDNEAEVQAVFDHLDTLR